MAGLVNVLIIGAFVLVDLVLIFKDRPSSRHAAARMARAGVGALLGVGTSKQSPPSVGAGGRQAPRDGWNRRASNGSGRQRWPGATSPFRVGDRVTPKRAIHRPSGTAWPGEVGTVVRIGDGGPFPDTLIVRFAYFTARGVFANELQGA